MDPISEAFKEALDPVIQGVQYLWAEWQPFVDEQLEQLGLPQEVKDRLREPNTYVLLAGAGLLVFLFLFMLLVMPRKREDTVVIVGPCDAGKTTLFYQLRDGSPAADTVASMQENQDTFPLAGEKAGAHPVTLVDVPGHPRVRGAFERHMGAAKGVVFLLDSVTFVPQKTDTAEQLYEVLSHPAVLSNRTPLLLACNKSDVGVKAHTPEFIRKMLEKELDQICGTRGSLDDGSRGSGDVALGRPGEQFSFEGLATAQGVKVTFAHTSCLSAEGAQPIAAFIRKCVPA